MYRKSFYINGLRFFILLTRTRLKHVRFLDVHSSRIVWLGLCNGFLIQLLDAFCAFCVFSTGTSRQINLIDTIGP